MGTKQQMTVVFEFERGALLPEEVLSRFGDPEADFMGARITAVSMENEIRRIEKYESVVDEQGFL